MAKQTRKKVTLADFEAGDRQFISLSFAFCEEELRRERRRHPSGALLWQQRHFQCMRASKPFWLSRE